MSLELNKICHRIWVFGIIIIENDGGENVLSGNTYGHNILNIKTHTKA